MKKLLQLSLVLTLCLTVLTGCGSSTTAATYEGTLSDAVNQMNEIFVPPFMVGEVPVEMADMNNPDSLKSYAGLSSADKISELVVSESMVGAQAYSLVMVRLNDSADASAVAQEMKDGIDTRKWICVEADDLQVVASGDVVMLVMVSSEYAADITSASVVDAFKTVVGELTVEL